MKQPKLLLAVLFLAISMITKAQDYNPYKSIGKKSKVVTAYSHEYVGDEEIIRIGSVLFNSKTKKVVKLLTGKSKKSYYTENTASSRWYGIDKKVEKYMPVSPYVFAGNNPILFKDPDGQDIIVSTSFKNSSYYSVYQKLMTASTVYKDRLKQYDNNKDYNYTLKTAQVKTSSPNSQATTPPDMVKKDGIGMVVKLDVSTTTFTLAETREVTGKDGTSSKMGLNDIGRALILLHEATHAFLHTITGGSIEAQDHGNMPRVGKDGVSYRSEIFDGLKEFATASGMELTKELTKNLEDISYYGLQGTKEFNTYFNIDTNASQSEQDKQTKAVIARLDSLIYTIQPKTN